jgi:hypothetical protein
MLALLADLTGEKPIAETHLASRKVYHAPAVREALLCRIVTERSRARGVFPNVTLSEVEGSRLPYDALKDARDSSLCSE